jgi:hypothetical protein
VKSYQKIRRANQRGLSLVELMIIIAVFAALAFGFTMLASGDSVKSDAETSARQWAQEMGIKVDGVSCGNRGNSKGQVYCTVNSGGTLTPLSCIGRYKIGSGCVPRVVTAPNAEQIQ